MNDRTARPKSNPSREAAVRIYSTIVEDRHTDVEVVPFYGESAAVAYAKNVVKEYGYENPNEESPPPGRSFFARLSGKGDRVGVREAWLRPG